MLEQQVVLEILKLARERYHDYRHTPHGAIDQVGWDLLQAAKQAVREQNWARHGDRATLSDDRLKDSSSAGLELFDAAIAALERARPSATPTG